MLELVFKGTKIFYGWLLALLAFVGIAFVLYIWQLNFGLGITGMSRDVSWGFYIAQFTFLIGVAAGGVMVVLPYYLHNYKAFGKITILGEFLAVAALCMCGLFIIVDLGQPTRMINIMLHPTPNSVLFWDMSVVMGYLGLNILVGWIVLEAERNGTPPPQWIKPFIYLSIPFAFGIHTVTAFLYCGLPGRGFWLTAVLAPRFLASAFSAGPALLIIMSFVLRRFTRFDAGKEAIQALAKIVTYALLANLFFFGCEIFVAMYSGIPEHLDHLKYLFFGMHGHGVLVPWMWTSMILLLTAALLLVVPATRQNETVLIVSCVLLFIGTWIDKGLGMISGGFVPNPMHHVNEYVPSIPEIFIAIGIWALGFFILSILYKIAISVKEEQMV